MTTEPFHFPSDVHNKIISKLDIDTRRSLNIYIKLRIPQKLQDKITKCIRPISCYILLDEELDIGNYPYRAYVIEVKHKPVKTKYHVYTKYYQISHEVFEKAVIYNIRQYFSSSKYVNDKDNRTQHERTLDKIRNLNNPDYIEPYPDIEYDNVECMKSTYYGLPDGSVRTTAIGSTDDIELINTHYYGEDCDIQLPKFSYAQIFHINLDED